MKMRQGLCLFFFLAVGLIGLNHNCFGVGSNFCYKQNQREIPFELSAKEKQEMEAICILFWGKMNKIILKDKMLAEWQLLKSCELICFHINQFIYKQLNGSTNLSLPFEKLIKKGASDFLDFLITFFTFAKDKHCENHENITIEQKDFNSLFQTVMEYLIDNFHSSDAIKKQMQQNYQTHVVNECSPNQESNTLSEMTPEEMQVAELYNRIKKNQLQIKKEEIENIIKHLQYQKTFIEKIQPAPGCSQKIGFPLIVQFPKFQENPIKEKIKCEHIDRQRQLSNYVSISEKTAKQFPMENTPQTTFTTSPGVKEQPQQKKNKSNWKNNENPNKKSKTQWWIISGVAFSAVSAGIVISLYFFFRTSSKEEDLNEI